MWRKAVVAQYNVMFWNLHVCVCVGGEREREREREKLRINTKNLIKINNFKLGIQVTDPPDTKSSANTSSAILDIIFY